MTLRSLFRALGLVAVAAAVVPATAAASGSPSGPPSLPTSAPFQQCPAVFQDASCGYLIDITGSGGTSSVYVDPSIGYYEGQDDVLVGVQNDSSNPVSSIHVGVPGSGYGSFGFDGDGLCTPGGGPVPAGCPFGGTTDPGDYFGPDTQLTPDSGTIDSGTVTFPIPLQPGQYTYFSLESPFSGATVVTGNQNDVIETQLSDSSFNTSAHLSESSPTDVTDTAQILPVQSNPATKSVVFTVYNDPACTNAIASFTVPLSSNSATTPAFGSTFANNATYYIQATYSGDSNYNAATTNCGDETLTFGTPPQKPASTVTTSLRGANGVTGSSITVPTGTAVQDTATVTSNGQPQSGKVTYYVYSDSACTQQVPGVDLGAVPSSSGTYGPSNAATLGLGTYYFQAIYSGNSGAAAARSPCNEVLTVAPPCNCSSLSAYLNSFHVFGAGSTRLEFNFHSAINCTSGAGGCAGTITVVAPSGAQFIDSSKAKNGATGVKLKKSTAVLTFNCSGPCLARTVQPALTLQWVALKTVTLRVKRGHHFVKVKRTIAIKRYTPQGRARKTIKVKLIESCNGATKTVMLSIKFDKHGQVDYKHSDLNGDGKADGGKLGDLNGFA